MSLDITLQLGVEDVLTEAAPRLASSITPSTLISLLDQKVLNWPEPHGIATTKVLDSCRVGMFHDKTRQNKSRMSPPPPGWTAQLDLLSTRAGANFLTVTGLLKCHPSRTERNHLPGMAGSGMHATYIR